MSSSDIYYALIRYLIFGEPLERLTPMLEGFTEWKGVIRHAVRQSTVALHAQALLLLHGKGAVSLPDDMRLWLQAQAVHNMQAQHIRGEWMAEIAGNLTSHGISVVLMKGYGLSVLYGNPDYREQGDIDFFIGKEHYHEACRLLREAYPESYWESDEEGGKHFIFIQGEDMKRIVELHHLSCEFSVPADLRYYRTLEQQGMTVNLGSVKWGNATLMTPETRFNSLYVFLHLWTHFAGGGCGWRQLTDWALVLRQAHDEGLLDRQWYDEVLTRLHLKKQWQTFGLILYRCLNLPKEMIPLYSDRYTALSLRIESMILRDGHGHRPAGRFYQMERPDGRLRQIVRVLGRIYESWAFLLPLFPSTAFRNAWHRMLSAAGLSRHH